MSGCNCSVKVSVHERTDVDYERAEEDTGVERSDRRGGGGRANGGERAPCVATAGSVQEGGSNCHSSREQGQEAVHDHGNGYTTEGQGVGRRPLRRVQPHPPDRGAWPSARISICRARRSGGCCWQVAYGVPGLAERPGASAAASATRRKVCCCRSTAASTTGSRGEAPT